MKVIDFLFNSPLKYGLFGQGPLGWFAYGIWMLFKKYQINKNTKKIVIMGTKGSGKTTLWMQLQGKPFKEDYGQTYSETVEEFIFATKSGRAVKVAKTKDYGGGNEFIPYFKELLEDGTFVILLVDLANLTDEAKGQTLATLHLLSKTLNLKSKGAGIKVIGTNFNKFSEGYKSKEVAKTELKKFLGLEKLKRYSIKSLEVIELRNSADIETIKEEIANS